MYFVGSISNKSSPTLTPHLFICLDDTKQEVQCITEEDLASTKIGDVVLPLPGYDTVFPNNSIGIFMADLLKKDGLSSENFKQSVK